MLNRIKDILTSLIVFILAVVMWFVSNNIIDANVSELGPEFMPKIVAVALAIVSLILLVNSLLAMIYNTRPHEETQEENQGKVNKGNVLLTIGLLFLYVALLNSIGFILMTVVFIFFQIMIYSENKSENLARNLILSVCVTAIVFVVFYFGFDILVPLGIFG